MSTLSVQSISNLSNLSISGTFTVTNVNVANTLSVSAASITGALVPSSSFQRNRIINGAMQIAQRGTSGTTGYLLDRWVAVGTNAQSQSSDAPSGFINSLEFSSSTATFPFIDQRIERINSYDLAGRTVTLSFWAKNVSGSSSLYAEIYRANSNDNFSSVTQEGIVFFGGLNPSSSWTYYTGTVTLSANATTGIVVRIVRNDASAATTRITGVQLEVGDAATPFERRHFGQELMLCQRYYSEVYVTPTSTSIYMFAYLPATMRTAPTISVKSGSFAGASYSAFGSTSIRQNSNSAGATDAVAACSAEL